MQNLRNLQQNSNMKSLHVTNSNASSPPNALNNEKSITSPRRGIKVRSPRRIEQTTGQTAVIPQNHTQSPNVIPTITPAALVVTKPMETQHTVTLPNQPNIQQIIPNVSTLKVIIILHKRIYYSNNLIYITATNATATTAATITANYSCKWKISESNKSSKYSNDYDENKAK